MATVHRTFVNRGKKEVTELKPNFAYAVEYNLPADRARELGIRIDQIGLITTNALGNITHNYNLAVLGKWEEGSVVLPPQSHTWFASEMEIDFATGYTAHRDLCARFNMLRSENHEMHNKLTYYKSNRLHRIASWLNRKMRNLWA